MRLMVTVIYNMGLYFCWRVLPDVVVGSST